MRSSRQPIHSNIQLLHPIIEGGSLLPEHNLSRWQAFLENGEQHKTLVTNEKMNILQSQITH